MACLTRVQQASMIDVFWSLILLGAMVCLLPISCSLFVRTYDFYDPQTTSDLEHSLSNSKFYRDSLAAGIYIIIIPGADLLLEIPAMIANTFSSIKQEILPPSMAVRLTDFERSCVITGVIIRSISAFMPLDNPYTQLAYDSTKNSSTILLTCPVIMFFARCTTTWTPKLTMFVIALTVISNIFESFKSFFSAETAPAIALESTSNVMVFIAVLIAFGLSLKCLFKYTFTKQGHRLSIAYNLMKKCFLPDKEVEFNVDEEMCPKITKKIGEKEIDEMYENYIPAWHMFVGSLTALIYLVSALTTATYPERIAEILGAENYAILVCATMILIAEYHIRKNEVVRGLVSS